MFSGLSVFACFTTVLLFQTARCGKKTKDWDHHVTLGENAMYHSGMEASESDMCHVYWTVQGKEITFQIEVATKGWIGFGLSPTGGVAGSDIIIGWVDGGKSYLYDYYAKDDSTLVVDKQQDCQLLSGKENKTHTILKFSRRLETCDVKDRAITNDSQHLIYAHYPSDPNSPTSVNFRQTVWTSHNARLLQPRIEEVPIPDDVLQWDVRVDNFTVPARSKTFYLCQIFRSPPLKRKHHIIKVTPVIRPQNLDVLHHITMHLCTPGSIKEAEEALAYGPGQCYQDYLPSLFFKCSDFYAGWGRGGGSFIYPMHVGLPLGETTQYFKIEMHFDNPSFRKGIVDDSGLRYYYASKLRPNDAGSIIAGTSTIRPVTNVYPPGEEEFIGVGHVHPICLAQRMPKEGTRIFAVWLHAHMLARKIKVRHFRKNIELPPIAMDLKFQSHFQEFVFLERDVRILPGDQITVECADDTRGEVRASLNGLGTEEDMCLAFLYNYPPIVATLVGSYPTIELIGGLTGMNVMERNYTIAQEVGYPNPDYADFLQDYDWPESQRCLFQNALRYSPQSSVCLLEGERFIKVPMTTYPENLKPYAFPDECKGQVRRDRDMISRCDYHA